VAILTTQSPESWFSFATTALNVFQTLALAYLAADRHNVNQARRQGQGTRVTDQK
jgi:hypothetical protein